MLAKLQELFLQAIQSASKIERNCLFPGREPNNEGVAFSSALIDVVALFLSIEKSRG
jgi:hypothetical protein